MSPAASADTSSDAAAQHLLSKHQNNTADSMEIINSMFYSVPDLYPTPSSEWARRALSEVVSLVNDV